MNLTQLNINHGGGREGGCLLAPDSCRKKLHEVIFFCNVLPEGHGKRLL